jgi:phosphatidylglycerophosphate synthase
VTSTLFRKPTQAGPATGLLAQLIVLSALAETTGLGVAGWVVGVVCAVIMAAALARGGRLGPASWVTLARATLAVGVAALVADSFTRDTPVALLVTAATVALALDAVDGWVARRTATESALGARFDGETDAFLIGALSVYVAPEYGAWVLAIGAARYLFGAGEWLLPWMRRPLPPRRWRKAVAATQGIVLTVAAAEVLPRGVTQALLLAALALLVGSMAECTWWLWRRRDDLAPPPRRQRRAHPRQQPLAEQEHVARDADGQDPGAVPRRRVHAQRQDEERVGLAVEARAGRRHRAGAPGDLPVDQVQHERDAGQHHDRRRAGVGNERVHDERGDANGQERPDQRDPEGRSDPAHPHAIRRSRGRNRPSRTSGTVGR